MTDYMRGFEQTAARAGMTMAMAVIEQLLARHPQATAEDALVFLADRLYLMPGSNGIGPGEVQCRHCGHPIAWRVPDGRWTHRQEGLWGSPGCLTATFDRDGSWDDSLEADMTAEPWQERSQ